MTANIVFQDNFDSGVWSKEWISKFPQQWVKDGWLYTQDTNGWPLDSMALVHDKDAAWTNYTISLTADFVGSFQLNVLLRTNGFLRASGVSKGTGYQLEFFKDINDIDPTLQKVAISKSNAAIPETKELQKSDWSYSGKPFNIIATLNDAHIQVWADGYKVIDFIDNNPFLFGGIGVHAIWTQKDKFDNILVTANKWSFTALENNIHYRKRFPIGLKRDCRQ